MSTASCWAAGTVRQLVELAARTHWMAADTGLLAAVETLAAAAA